MKKIQCKTGLSALLDNLGSIGPLSNHLQAGPTSPPPTHTSRQPSPTPPHPSSSPFGHSPANPSSHDGALRQRWRGSPAAASRGRGSAQALLGHSCGARGTTQNGGWPSARRQRVDIS